jgi:hypothetical protein
MEVERRLDTVDLGDDSVTRIVPSGAATAQVGVSSEDVDEFAFACSTP